MVKNSFLLIILMLIGTAKGQDSIQFLEIKQMKWGLDYQIYLDLSNDSTIALPIENLFHALPIDNPSGVPSFTFFPVRLDSSYRAYLREKYADVNDFTFDLTIDEKEPITLWGNISQQVGGGWVHFLNCIMYSLESGELDLKSPLMERPKTKWKPNPITLSYKRTKDWQYYIPTGQKEARKEYKKRKKENDLDELSAIHPDIIELFLKTNQREYNKMLRNKEYHMVAKIDMIKILLGSKYMGKAQIAYFKSRVLKAVTKQSYRQMPSVLIFDQYQAAVSLTLDESGYIIDKIVINNEDSFDSETLAIRKAVIYDVISRVNEENKVAFQNRLKEIYIK